MMKVTVEYHYTLLGGTNGETFGNHARTQAVGFFGEDPDEVVVVVTQTGHGVNNQYRGDCVATKRVETA